MRRIDTLQHIGYLVDQSRRGDEAAFERLYHRFREPVYKAARYRVGEMMAPDVAQEAFYRAWRHLPTLRESERFGPWLMRIVHNVCVEMGRKLGVEPAYRAVDLDAIAHPLADQARVSVEERIDLHDLLSLIPASYLEVLQLHYQEDLTVPEISLLTGLAVSTVKWRIHRGIELCRLAARKRQDGSPAANEGVTGRCQNTSW
ncbi:MAG: sigma-70 family RNA polymerase sigma factor [Alicyclobacillus sp.]|nr:sigma-70 family RNA polymerase sigma factor [Alicyclobacillus sp.]